MARQWTARSPRAEKVVDLLRERVEQSGHSCRAIEIKAGLPLGALSLMLAGRSPVTLEQLEALAGVIGFQVFDVMLEAYGPQFNDNPAGRTLRILTKRNPRIVGLLSTLGFRPSGGSHR
jgi:hypothetical protein